jgi:hypothetical protein
VIAGRDNDDTFVILKRAKREDRHHIDDAAIVRARKDKVSAGEDPAALRSRSMSFEYDSSGFRIMGSRGTAIDLRTFES